MHDENEPASSSDDVPGQAKQSYSSGTVSREKWIEMMNRANPLDRHLMEKKEFEKQEPPEEAIKLFRDGRIRYLLNFSPVDITRLRYRKRPGHRTKDVDPAPLDMEVEGLPARSYVAVDDGFDPNVDTSSFALIEAAWADGSTFKEARALLEYDPVFGLTASCARPDRRRARREAGGRQHVGTNRKPAPPSCSV